MNSNKESRINELIAELSDCREDERNTQNQILQVISLVGTILGILFGASYLNSGSSGTENTAIVIFQNLNSIHIPYINTFCSILNEKITNTRVMFWLSMLIFCTAFTYIIVLGINNLLRYFYIQNIEDRLKQLINSTTDDTDRGNFLHWNEYSAPIITRNAGHITSSHTALYYICYTIAICCAILFSMGLVISLFLKINPREWFDYFIMYFMIIFMVITLLLFFRLSNRAKDVAQFSWDTAHENQKVRLGELKGELYGKSESFKHIIKYLLYPKKQDLQKPVLIILGFIFGAFFSEISINVLDLQRLLFVLLVFDFLAYQARYQINDIRGIKEDNEAGLQNRLLSKDINNPEHVIKVSFKIAMLKILFSIILTICYGRQLKNLLLSSLLILLISTIIYEFARKKNITWLIFGSVGIGYPLRFFIGFFSIVPLYNICTDKNILLLYVVALWAYGSFSSVLAWTNEVVKRMQKNRCKTQSFPLTYEKKHYEYLQNIIKSRYIIAEKNPINQKVIPLREKGKLGDPWNILLIASILFLTITALYEKISIIYLVLELLFILFFIINIYVKYRKKLIIMSLGWACIIIKIILGIFYFNITKSYILLSLMQMLITVTYFILYYQPQFKKIKIKEILKILFCKAMYIILGKYAADIVYLKKDNKKD